MRHTYDEMSCGNAAFKLLFERYEVLDLMAGCRLLRAAGSCPSSNDPLTLSTLVSFSS